MCSTGTGTPAGDPVEVNALGSFFKKQGQPRDRYIGSVKTNIGHTESAAGVLGLIKVLLMMKHNTIVPSLHCDVVNPKIDLLDLRFIIPQTSTPWVNAQKRAGCNSFGFGGSNAHVIVCSFSAPGPKHPPQKKRHCIVCFSGKTRKALKGSLEDLYTDVEAPLLNVHDVSYTSTVRRDHHIYRAAFVVDDMQDLLTDVGEQLSRDEWSPPSPSQPNVIFVFCGMGTAWEGMCRQLLAEHQVFRDTMLEVEKHLSAYVPWSLVERLQQEDPSKDRVLAPIAIFACQVCLSAVWRSLGIQPSCVVGQSIGEVAAAYTAGCLTLADAVKIIYQRSQLLAQVTGGAMVVVLNVEVDKVKEVLNGTKSKANVSLEYSPRACAVSADFETMQSLKPRLLTNLKPTYPDMRLLDLDVLVAYHSSHVNMAADQLTEVIQGITPKEPSINFVSTVTGKAIKGPLNVGHWADNMKKPVLFHQAVINSVPSNASSSTVFLEIGPKPVLRAHMEDLFPDGQHKNVASATKPSEIETLSQAVCKLYEYGAEIDWTSLQTQENRLTDVPRYWFDKKYLKEKTEAELVSCSGYDVYKKVHLCVYQTEENPAAFGLLLSPLTIPSVYHHVVMGKIVIPGALYAECGFAVANYSHTTTPISVSVEFEQLLSLEKDELIDVKILPHEEPASEGDARDKAFVVKKNDKKLATILLTEESSKPQEHVNMAFLRSKCTERVDKSSIYATLKRFEYEYGEAFSLLVYAHRNLNECLATLQVNDIVSSEMSGTTIHPCILDCMLQSTVIALGDKIPTKELLPKSIAGLSVHGKMETTMYVHARVKSTSPSFFLFGLKLLCMDGRVIAEVTDFMVQVLTSQAQEATPAMLAVQWTKVKDTTPDMFRNEGHGREKKILLISNVPHRNSAGHVNLIRYDCNDQTLSVRKELAAFLTTHSVDALVLEVSRIDRTAQEGDVIKSRLVNICLLIQSVFGLLSEHSFRVPAYVCTFDAWPSVSGNTKRDVNPTATALWGLLRTVVAEDVYPVVRAVELHSSLDQLDSWSTQCLVEFLMTNNDIADYPEMLVTKKAVYVNHVVAVSSSPSMPKRRRIAAANMNDIKGNAVILSKASAKLSRLYVVHEKSPESPEHHTTLRGQTFAQPPEKLFNTRISSLHLLPERAESSSDYVVMALEVTGHTAGGTSQELTSCCPLAVGPEVTVPMDTTIETASIPQYQAGDLSKLVLFWSLIDRVPTSQFTILASRSTLQFAQLLKLLSWNASQRGDSDVNIVMTEELKEVVSYKETVLSLVLVDVDLMSMMAKHWKEPHCLVSCYCLLTSDVTAFVACVLPDAELRLVDTQVIFQLPHLKRLVPAMKKWIRENTGLMPEVSKHLHSKDVENSDRDICELLQFICLHLQDLSVELEEEKLFRKDGVYLVVGGLTGLGWMCVEFLAQNNAGYIAILNRRTPSEEQLANMEILSRLHDCQIKSYQADISSVKSLEQVMQLITTEWSQHGQLRGIFTGAAVVQDSSFLTMDRSAFEKVLSPKVQGAWNLHLLTKDLPLDYFVMHSSVASVLGNLGQANYSAANGFLDGLAFHRRHLGLAAQTINWGPLDSGLLDKQDKLQKKLESMGFHVASHEEILDALQMQMLLNSVQTVPVRLNRETYSSHILRTNQQVLIKRLGHLLSGPSQQYGSTNSLGDVVKIRFLDPAQRLQKYEAFVKELTARILSVDKALITSDVNLFELGLDSVKGMMMINVIERETAFKLSAVRVLSGEPTVASLAQVLDARAEEMAG